MSMTTPNGNGGAVRAEWLWRAVSLGLTGVAVYFIVDVHKDLKAATAKINHLLIEDGRQAMRLEDHEKRLNRVEDWRYSNPVRTP